jgi:hypothetical protein
MKRSVLVALLCLAAAFSETAFAQQSGSAGKKTLRIDARERHEQKRIKQGLRSGELTRREARKLEAEQRKIKADEAPAKSDGKVTKKERKQLHKELNRASRHIYREKHDAQKRR